MVVKCVLDQGLCARVDPDGAFEGIVSEPSQSHGTLKARAREGAIPGAYTCAGQQWTLK